MLLCRCTQEKRIAPANASMDAKGKRGRTAKNVNETTYICIMEFDCNTYTAQYTKCV